MYDVYTEIIPGKLYLGGDEAIEDCVRREKVRSFVRVMWEPPFGATRYVHPRLLHIKIDDHDTTNIKQYFNECNKFIDENDKVLVHCRAGMSRSPTIVIAYLMYKNKWGWSQAFDYVYERRMICPNSGFIRQLKEYELR